MIYKFRERKYFCQRPRLGEGRQIIMTFPAEPHYKYIFINGEANRVQAFAKPRVSCDASINTVDV